VFVDPEDLSVDPDRAPAIFRIFQETLTNVARHAGATKVEAALERLDGSLRSKSATTGGDHGGRDLRREVLGIIGIRERVRYLGGEVPDRRETRGGDRGYGDPPEGKGEAGCSAYSSRMITTSSARPDPDPRKIVPRDRRGRGGGRRKALALMEKGSYALVLLDISMPGRGGLEVLKEVKRLHPGVPVLILSMHPEEEYAVRAFRAGASGYLTKDRAADELVQAVRTVLAGRRYMSASLTEMLVRELESNGAGPRHNCLSDRELQVMRMLASGRTVTEIADELSLSVKTISTYRSRILEKLQVRNNAELARYAFENRL